MRTGHVCERPTSAPRTAANAGSASPGLPTPRARDSKGPGYPDDLPTTVETLLPTPTTSEGTGTGHAARGGMNLRHTVSLLPTPRASERENRQTKRSPSQEAGRHGLCLAAEVATLLPTPRASDTGTPGRRASEGFRPPLSQVLLPTPKATDGTKGGPNQRGSSGDLTLPSATHRIGDPTPPPSPAGKPSPAAGHPGQLTIDDA
ncbi:hypothetical protein [Sphaerisporangium rhizosphaerae]|uniref:Uncharacterized protein n=1 Tax=Sphaerisporangium rhizosphaerae TaxID=2269375 RepID=A0ABW2P231_9ACTN